MEELNPYAPPVSGPEAQVSAGESTHEPAGRGTRLGAILIDTVLLGIVGAPLLIYSRPDTDSIVGNMLISLIALVLSLLIQGYPLLKDGQSWGKKVVGIKIVGMNGEKPKQSDLLVRHVFMNGIGLIPFIGGFISLGDTLSIFSADRRCLHDRLVGTSVVLAK